MAKKGRKPLIPDKFFVVHPSMPYDEAIQVLKSYGVMEEFSENYYYKKMEESASTKRGRKSAISNALFIRNYKITDPKEMATALHCDTAYAKNRMIELDMTINEKESELEEVVEQVSTEPKKCGRKPRLADELFLKNYKITDPEEMAKKIRRSCDTAYARKRMDALGMTVTEEELESEEPADSEEPMPEKRTGRQPRIPEEFFIKNPNMDYDSAKKVLEDEYQITELIRHAYYERRLRLKDRIPEIVIKRGNPYWVRKAKAPEAPKEKKYIPKSPKKEEKIPDTPKKKNFIYIPDKFFEDHPELTHEEAAWLLKREYDIIVERSTYSKKRSGFMERVLHSHPSNASDSIEDLFFNRTMNMSIDDVIACVKQDYNINILRADAVYRRVFNIMRRAEKDSSLMDKFHNKDHIVSVEEFTEAVYMSTIIKGKPSIEHDDARELANHVLNFFGFGWRIIDNVLTPDDRDAFYMLEDNGLLTTEREETTLYDGREWRIHYWVLNIDRIVQLTTPQPEVKASDLEKEIEFYLKELPEEAWLRQDIGIDNGISDAVSS